MAAGVLTFFYKRLGRWYPLAFMAVELQTALLIVGGTLALFTFYFDGDTHEYLTVLGIALVLTEAAILTSLWRVSGQIRPISDWIDGSRDEPATERAWSAAIGLPILLLKRDLPIPVLVSVLPTCVAGILILDLPALAIFPLLAGAAVAMGYSAILHYLAVEAGMRPVLLDINSSLSPRLADELLGGLAADPAAGRAADDQPDHRPGRRRAHLERRRQLQPRPRRARRAAGGDHDLARAHRAAVEVDPAAAARPLAGASSASAEGDYDVAVPVTTGDELGELAASFNQMVEGLARARAHLREAFGTYLDREVADYILSEGFSRGGGRGRGLDPLLRRAGFTEFASRRRRRRRWSRALNALFEVIVPIIAAHGGHVDKFEGDGLMAVFGAPEPFPTTPTAPSRAACEIGTAVNERGAAGELRVGVGVNTGRVIAGSIGGAGRLNFCVIGDAVNVAARVEAHTRETGDDDPDHRGDLARLSHEFEVEQPRPGRAQGRRRAGVALRAALRRAGWRCRPEPPRRRAPVTARARSARSPAGCGAPRSRRGRAVDRPHAEPAQHRVHRRGGDPRRGDRR